MNETVTVRQAQPDEYEAVSAFYDRVIDGLAFYEYRPGWQKGVYPSYEYLHRAVSEGWLYVCAEGADVCGAMIVNSSGNDGYRDARWGHELAEGEYLVIHALASDPRRIRQGIGSRLVGQVLRRVPGEYRGVRLDVLKGNLAANRLYESMGFTLCDTVRMYYADTGWTEFELYEYVPTL